MRTSLMIALLIVVGCGGGGGKPQVNANKDNVCGQIADVACYNLYQCCSESQIESYLRVTDPRTEDQCRSDVTRLCEQRVGIVDASIKAGRVTFDGKIMNSCLSALTLPDNACSTVSSTLPWTAACMTTAWVGAVANGGMCSYRYECADANSYCAANQTCTALPTDGMACSVAGCASGTFCTGGTCRALLGAGAQCNSTAQCMKGMYCNNAATRVCATLQGPGQPCTGNQSCQSNQCLPGVCSGTTNTCFANTDCGGHCSNNANAFCTVDGNCGNGTCSVGGATCNSPAQCVGIGNTCVFPNTCVLSSCVGDVVCADTQIKVDYCTGAVGALPAPP